MSIRKHPKRGDGLVVEGAILPTMVIDCSGWIDGNTNQQWTRGPARLLANDAQKALPAKRALNSRTKRRQGRS